MVFFCIFVAYLRSIKQNFMHFCKQNISTNLSFLEVCLARDIVSYCTHTNCISIIRSHTFLVKIAQGQCRREMAIIIYLDIKTVWTSYRQRNLPTEVF